MNDVPAIPFVDFVWISEQIGHLKRRVLSLPEREMRHTVLFEFVMILSEGELVMVLYLVQQQAYSGDSRARELLQEMALEPSAISQLPYDFIRKAYQICVEHNLISVQRLFFADPPRKEDIDEAFTQNQYLDLPLGVRKQAARTQDRNIIDRLLHDRNWRVITLLLDNPRIVERDVVNIAARRPTRPELLEGISKHAKWSGRYRVRKALACNPYTPYPLARQLLGTLLRQDIQECLRLGVFQGALAEEARILLGEQYPKTMMDSNDLNPEILQEISNLASQLCLEFEIEEEIEEELENVGSVHLDDADDAEDIEDAEELDLSDLFAQAEIDLFQAELRPVGESEEEN